MLNVLLVGAGRMGLRHLRGIAREASAISVVYHRQDIDADVRQILAECDYEGTVNVVPSIELAADRGGKFDAAILSATAAGRQERFADVLALDIAHILLEKPLEQSRAAVLEMQALARRRNSDIRCNNVFREQPVFDHFRMAAPPFQMTVNAGAIGLACGGIHWIDLACFLSGDGSGQLISGTLEPRPIASGRGQQFRDFGGYGLFQFEDGSNLFIRVAADSSAPAVCVITQQHRQLVIDNLGGVLLHQRTDNADQPNYLYGQGYETRQAREFFDIDLPVQTRLWLQHVKGQRSSKLPRLTDAARSHQLLFDLLQTDGGENFPIT